MNRPSRAKVFVDWGKILDEIERGGTVEVKKPPHLSIYQTRDKILSLASCRGIYVDYRIILGHLDVWKVADINENL